MRCRRTYVLNNTITELGSAYSDATTKRRPENWRAGKRRILFNFD